MQNTSKDQLAILELEKLNSEIELLAKAFNLIAEVVESKPSDQIFPEIYPDKVLCS